jgi:hypothetical protein
MTKIINEVQSGNIPSVAVIFGFSAVLVVGATLAQAINLVITFI